MGLLSRFRQRRAAEEARKTLKRNGYCPVHGTRLEYSKINMCIYPPLPGWCNLCRQEEREKDARDVENARRVLGLSVAGTPRRKELSGN